MAEEKRNSDKKAETKAKKSEEKAPVQKKDRLAFIKKAVRSNSVSKKVFDDIFVTRTFIGVTFFFLALIVFSPLINRDSDLLKILVSLYGFLVIALILGLFYELIKKTVWLQRVESYKGNFATLFSVNLFLGLVMPLIYLNVVLEIIVRAFSLIPSYGTILCEIRMAFVRFYYSNGIPFQMGQLTYWLIIMVAVLFIFGNFFEKLYRRK